MAGLGRRVAAIGLVILGWRSMGMAAQAPVVVGPVSIGHGLVVLPDGTWEAFKARQADGRFELVRERSTDRGRTWSKP